ncbi:hypothetical protein MMC31_001809 [Peltigera leucophlebia]|nr:hypothetical protein [Peltigera leucophlebia]
MSSDGVAITQGVKPEPTITMKCNSDTRQVETFLHTPSNPVPCKLPGTNDEWRDFLDQYMPLQTPKPTPPQQLSQGTPELYKRAIKEPGSLTEEEVLTILEWVPEALADTRCLVACGCTWQSLIKTAVETPQELTYDQVSFILHGRYSTYKDINAGHKRIFGKVNLPAEKRHLLPEAQKAAKNRQYAIAESNARRESSRIQDEKHEALSDLSGDDKENISLTMRIPWIAQLRALSKPHWGLVCFRIAYDNDEAWVKYKDHIVSSSRSALLSYPRTCSVSRKWKINFIENDKETLDGASFEDLCKSAVLALVILESSVDLIRYFKDPPASSSISSAISSGLRSDIFLFVDACAISSLNERPSDHWLEVFNPAPDSHAPIGTDCLIAGYVSVCDPS